MAELLRIQPQAPRLDPGQVRVPTPGGAYVGQGLEELGDAFQKVQYGASKAEATRSTLEGQADFKNILQDSINSFSDENEFREEATNRIKESYQARLAAASKGARPLIEANLSNDLKAMLDRGGQIDQHYVGKTRERGIAEYTTAKEALRLAAIGGDEAEQRRVGRIFGDLVGDMTRAGYMKRDSGAKELVDFARGVEAESMNLEAAANPAQFIKKQQEGAYQGRDSTAVDRALDIASRVGDARARKDAAEMKLASEAAERSFEIEASERRLDIKVLEGTARYYGWDKNKVDGLIKMQTGLKAANPYELIAIRDALLPVDSTAMYTMADIIKADRALSALVKGGQADVRTPEYVSAIRHLQALRSNLTIRGEIHQRQGEIRGRQSTSDARQDVQDLYNEFHPRSTNKQVVADKAKRLSEVSDMPPDRQKAYTDKLRQQFERQRKENQTQAVPLDGLRSIPRR